MIQGKFAFLGFGTVAFWAVNRNVLLVVRNNVRFRLSRRPDKIMITPLLLRARGHVVGLDLDILGVLFLGNYQA